MTAAAKVTDPGKPRRAVDRIRETARDLFYRRGIRDVGVEEIVTTAGVTKPSLYRAFASKDELAAAYIRDYDREFWDRFEAVTAPHAGDPKAQVLAWVQAIEDRTRVSRYRGCGMTNAAVEYPDRDHPARRLSVENKKEYRRRLRALARDMGARNPDLLGDGLLLLIEGTYASAQLFEGDGPAVHLAAAAAALIDASL
ncbi:TetR/AcrR family transcriptional regulator [Zavarzinia compransoris]|uniref:TetR family transcriptional regulator n=1 Tax=Zavarzinia compransoris TaxID=1264899 RepID=A0A317E569_9PROT|nr:TetR/AcrR family transcriptional regulator [Zavarzinia compransoris]PWR22139.1 TetR family transcriptional regulator [Zavarzinia compransoris]TDP47110.1 TetR family transcriptional regulator [Zavarzinia compransoris]